MNIKRKKSNYRFVSILIMILFFISSCTSISLGLAIPYFSIMEDSSATLSYVTHNPITIISDDNFTDYGFLGDGSEFNPFMIEDYSIVTTEDTAIYIFGTTSYFVIRNCYIDAYNRGIHIIDAASGTVKIINNTCNNQLIFGIGVENIDHTTIMNNTCIYNKDGIYLYNSDYATVSNNTCSDNSSNGIYSRNSPLSNFINNTCNDNYFGIYIYDSDSSIISNNTCYDSLMIGLYLLSNHDAIIENNTCTHSSAEGLFIQNCDGSRIANNRLYESGILIDDNINDYSLYSVENNWVNDKEFGFFIHLVDENIINPIYGQIISVNCTNTTISNQNLDVGKYGIRLVLCENMTISHNVLTGEGMGYCIILLSSDNIEIINNAFSNYNGIHADFSSNLLIYKNSFEDNTYTVSLSSCHYSIIANNTFSNNLYALNMYFTNYSIVQNNTLISNSYAILLYGCSFCNISYNLLQETIGYGVYLGSDSGYLSVNNTVFCNAFIDNNLGGTSQAKDDCVNNRWYDEITNEGNYWSDWIVGDYTIDGTANAADLYPLGESPITIIAEYQFNYFFILISLIPVIGLISYIRKRKKDSS